MAIAVFVFVLVNTVLASSSQHLPNASTTAHNVATSSRNASIYKPLFETYSPSKPVFLKMDELNHNASKHLSNSHSLSKRVAVTLPPGSCAPGQPCTNGACCSNVSDCVCTCTCLELC
jgi:hypothetical protein